MHSCMPDGPDLENARRLLRTLDGPEQQAQVNATMAKWAEICPAGMVIPADWEYEDGDPDVHIVVDTPPLTFSAQYAGVTRSGERTIDTFLDQILFGGPITGFDLGKKSTFARGQQAPHQRVWH